VSFDRIHSKVLRFNEILEKPELTACVTSPSFETMQFIQDKNINDSQIMAEAIEIRGMLKMMSLNVSTFEYFNEYIGLIKGFASRNLNAKDLLLNQKISIIDRICVLLRFEPVAFLNVLDECLKIAIEMGFIEFIVLLEAEEDIVNLIQSYLDRSGDIQTCAILGVKLISLKMVTREEPVNRLLKFYKEYQIFLDKNGLYLERAKLDEQKIDVFLKLQNLTKEDQTKDSEFYLNCFSCKAPYALNQYVVSF
jgi:hypothetical protein